MTISIKMSGRDVMLMLDQDDGDQTPGGFFEVPSVDDLYDEKKDVRSMGLRRLFRVDAMPSFVIRAETLSQFSIRPSNSNPPPCSSCTRETSTTQRAGGVVPHTLTYSIDLSP